ncbi:ArgE/DapE family deacylase [Peptoniphilaceae bacterium SGI.137]|nr:ArgE/DapE family deacylase [Peptoniphilaceae bacterium]
MNKDESIQILQDVIRIASENDHEQAVAEYYQKLLASHNIESKLVKYADGRCSLVAEIENGSGKTLALSGHMDVVSVGDEKEWKYPPYSGHIEDGVIWGRGTSDMKSGLSALIIAMIDLHQSKRFHGKIRLLATVGEELGELGSAQLADEGYVDDVDGLLIGEPCNTGIVYAHKGSLNYKIISRGVAAHSSTPEMGSNAILHLLEAIHEINQALDEKIELLKNDKMGKAIHNVTLISGGSQINSIPDYAEFQANARTIPELDNEDFIQCIQEVLNRLQENEEYHFELVVTANQPPVEANPDSDLMRVILKTANQFEQLKPKNLISTIENLLGEDVTEFKNTLENIDEIVPVTAPATTDAAQFMRKNKNMDLAVYGPGVPTLNHKINERLPLSQYIDFIEAYKQIIENYLS